VEPARHLAERGHPREEGIQVLECQLPAVARVGQELLHHTERRLHQAAGIFVPTGQRRYVRILVLREESQQLELRVDAGL
jgi:hypothetical protein